MPKLPTHIRLMLERCAEDEHLALESSCGCKVTTVVYGGEKLPLVNMCEDHKEEIMACTEPDPEHPEPVALLPQSGKKYLN